MPGSKSFISIFYHVFLNAQFSETVASLVYKASSMAIRATQRKLILKVEKKKWENVAKTKGEAF